MDEENSTPKARCACGKIRSCGTPWCYGCEPAEPAADNEDWRLAYPIKGWVRK